MPGDYEELERRMTAVEQEVRLARADAAAARVLAGGADRDVSVFGAKLDAHTKSLNALRETQIEQGERLDRLERKVDEGFAKLGQGMAHITALLERIAEPE